MKIKNNASPNLINYYLRELKITQTDLARKYQVSQALISQAINNYPGEAPEKLREKIILFIKHKEPQAA